MHTHIRTMKRYVARFIDDEGGQDLIEYALLSAVIGIAGVLLFPLMQSGMQDAYEGWNTAAQDAWEPCPPGGCW